MKPDQEDKSKHVELRAILRRARVLRKKTAERPITDDEIHRAKKAGRC